MHNFQSGQLAFVTLIVIAALAVFGVMFFSFQSSIPPELRLDATDTASENAAPQIPPTPVANRLVWSNSATNVKHGFIGARAETSARVSIGPTANVEIAVTAGVGTSVTLIDPSGKKVIPSSPASKDGTKVSQSSSTTVTETTTTYTIAGNTQSGDWTVALLNEGDEDSSFTVEVPQGAAPLDISPEVGSTVNAYHITISLTVQETVGETPQPITGADVIAHVTDPNEQTSLVVL
ncbi:MAG TPA: hypothetical protein VJI74_01940, partial [Candidatus Paceibacterota bacterium]